MSNTGLGLGHIPGSTHSAYPVVERPDAPTASSPAAATEDERAMTAEAVEIARAAERARVDHALRREGPARVSQPQAHTERAPMFALVAGELPRPLRKRSGVPAVASTAVHGAAFATLLLAVAMTNRVTLPAPKNTARLVAMLVAPPPPPPAPAAVAAPAPAAAAPGPAETRATPPPDPVPQEPALPREMPLTSLSDVPMPDLAPPPPSFFGGPALNTGLGSGFGGGSGDGVGAGFGVDGGVGWGTGASGPGTPVRVGGTIETPALIHRAEPVYPPDAASARIEGTVVIEATVDESGVVQSARVLHSIGPLDQAAIDAVMQWRYSPLRVGNQAASFIVTVNVSFRLR